MRGVVAERRYGSADFKVGHDLDNKRVTAKLADFLRCYASDQLDDSPMYAFDGTFDEASPDRGSKHNVDDGDDDNGDDAGCHAGPSCRLNMWADYEVPKYFRDDLFSLIGTPIRRLALPGAVKFTIRGRDLVILLFLKVCPSFPAHG